MFATIRAVGAAIGWVSSTVDTARSAAIGAQVTAEYYYKNPWEIYNGTHKYLTQTQISQQEDNKAREELFVELNQARELASINLLEAKISSILAINNYCKYIRNKIRKENKIFDSQELANFFIELNNKFYTEYSFIRQDRNALLRIFNNHGNTASYYHIMSNLKNTLLLTIKAGSHNPAAQEFISKKHDRWFNFCVKKDKKGISRNNI